MRHGEIKKKFSLLVPVTRYATYINRKDPAGTAKAYPSPLELRKERQALQDKKNAGAASSAKPRPEAGD